MLGVLKVNSSSVPCCIAICSIDGKPLTGSKRMVLVYNTEIVNSGMELSPNREKMLKVGTEPILMRTGKLDALFSTENGKDMSLYALGFDGVRREKIPLEVEAGNIIIKLDTSMLKDGPTPFFELVKE
ncbi:hypothetical protein SDC9_203962 [bioreactor metagenome]|uniref:Uncharacterized protein n=1 Tax=bioreactor metagenome TaxID=1076179 RepID=A0A645IYK5_9ZZZZ